MNFSWVSFLINPSNQGYVNYWPFISYLCNKKLKEEKSHTRFIFSNYWEMKSKWNSNADLIPSWFGLFRPLVIAWLSFNFKVWKFYYFLISSFFIDQGMIWWICFIDFSKWFCGEIAVNCEWCVVDLLWIVICKNER